MDDFARYLEVDVCYLIDRAGLTLCSSNRNQKDSFVGHDFSFRPYFKNAMGDRESTYLALGTTSGRRGVYYSSPVKSTGPDGSPGEVIGAAVIKASVEFVESLLFGKEDHILLFVSPESIIFISNRDPYYFKTFFPLSEEKKVRILNSRQFGNGPWQWSGFSKTDDGYVTDQNGTRYLYTDIEVENYPGWHMISLRNYEQIAKQVFKPFAKILGPVILSILILIGVLSFILYQLGVREISRRKKAERELRLNEERYRHIYHKTPVMLHSIDTQGNVIRVSDHWVEVMGYDRNEVIGRQLTDFFSPESQKYAKEVIFPEFFRTGFCKDVPYTYIRKNGEKIDILLSCYGVRDEAGNVIRSLAVSVDVTEKNRSQKDLQTAKEQLSIYSRDLEQLVGKRTAQLELSRENLKTMSKNIIASQEREKALVAGELHDHLGQVLTALRIDSVWAEKQIREKDPAAGDRAGKMTRLIDTTISDVRDMAYRLRPRVLDDLGLADALESMLSDFERRSNVSCVFKSGPIPKIDDTISTALYRIGQEAVTNALRHSGATTIIVSLLQDAKGVLLEISDNGSGFDVQHRDSEKGFGIEGMKERANLIGGKLEISSRPEQGTRVCCKIKIRG